MIRLSVSAIIAVLFLCCAPAAQAQLATADDVSPDDYRIYRSDGTPASWADVEAALKKTDVVFVGELHNDPVSHKVEQEVLQRWFSAHGNAAALSLEMFSRDVQYIVDEYLAGLISDSHFQQSSSPWSNYETDYKPLVEFAREHDLDVIAANAPRRYANMVTRYGRESLRSLSDQARGYLAPLPYGGASERYTEQWNKVMSEAMAAMAAAPAEEPLPEEEGMRHAEGDAMEHGEMQHGEMDHAAEGHEMGEEHEHGEGEEHADMRAEHHGDMSDEDYAKMHAEHMQGGEEHEHGESEHGDEGHEMGEGHEHGDMEHAAEETEEAMPAMPSEGSGHGGGSMLDAQNLWDATMAWSIAEHMTRNPGSKVAHMVGGFHVETGTGTPEHLVQYRPGTRILIISVQSVDDPSTFDPAEHTGLGDFVVLGDASLPRTYDTRTR